MKFLFHKKSCHSSKSQTHTHTQRKDWRWRTARPFFHNGSEFGKTSVEAVRYSDMSEAVRPLRHTRSLLMSQWEDGDRTLTAGHEIKLLSQPSARMKNDQSQDDYHPSLLTNLYYLVIWIYLRRYLNLLLIFSPAGAVRVCISSEIPQWLWWWSFVFYFSERTAVIIPSSNWTPRCAGVVFSGWTWPGIAGTFQQHPFLSLSLSCNSYIFLSDAVL